MNGSDRDGSEQPATSDEALVARIRAGDEDALDSLFGRHRRALEQMIRRHLPRALERKVSVADVMQEAHLAAIARFADFEYRGDGSTRAWLKRIAELKARSAVQHLLGTAKRDPSREVTRSQRRDTAAFPGGGPTPGQQAITAEEAFRARRAVAELKDDDREVLRLVLEEQLTLREVAERMGRSREAAKKLYGRALGRFTKVHRSLRGGEP